MSNFDKYNTEYTILYKKKFSVDNDNSKYIFKFWNIDDFLLYSYNNKFIYDSINKYIKRYDHFDVFFYLNIKILDHNDEIYILTMEKYDDNKKIKDFVGFFSTYFDKKKNYCFAEHFLINPEYRGKGLCKIMVKFWNIYYTRLHKIPVYGAVYKSNEAALKCFLSGDYHIINQIDKHKDKIVIIGFDPYAYLKQKNKSSTNYQITDNIDVNFDIKKFYKDYNNTYHPLNEKKLIKLDNDNDKFLIKFWYVNDFLLYCYDNKLIYEKIKSNISIHNNFDIFFNFHLNNIFKHKSVYITTIETYQTYPKINNIISLLICYIDDKYKKSFINHLYIDKSYNNEKLGFKLIKYFTKCYTKLHSYPIYSHIYQDYISYFTSNNYIELDNLLCYIPKNK